MSNDASLANSSLVRGMGGGAQAAEEHRDATEHSGFVGSIGSGYADFDKIVIVDPSIDETDKLNKYLDVLFSFCEKVPRSIRDGDEDMSLELISDMGEVGLFALKVGNEHGGMGFSHRSYIEILSFLTTHFPSALIMVSAHNTIGALYPVLNHGTAEQKSKWMGSLCKWPSAFCFTEEKVGSDPARMESYAIKSTDGNGNVVWKLSGNKWYATNSAYADGVPLAKLLAVVVKIVDDPEKEIFRWSRLSPRDRKIARKKEFKELESKTHFEDEQYKSGLKSRYGCFIVPTDVPGVTVVQRTKFEGMGGIFNGILKFDNVELQEHHLIEGSGFKIALKSLTNGRLAIAKSCVAAAKRDIAGMTWYASKREQWDKMIIDHELIGAGIISSSIANAFACEAMIHYAATMADHHLDVRLEAALAKVAAARMQHQTVRDLNVLIGGRAFEKHTSLSKREECVPAFSWMKSSWPCETFEGSRQILTLWSERELDDLIVKTGLVFKTGSWWTKIKISSNMLGKYFKHAVKSIGIGSSHVAYIKRTSHRLVKTKIALYGKHKEALLGHKQLMQQRLVNIIIDLSMMASALQYASNLDVKFKTDSYTKLADFFCREARIRIKNEFDGIKNNNDDIACGILHSHVNGEYSKFLNDKLAPMDWLLVAKANKE